MKRMVVSILGEDRPGIIYAVSRVLSDLNCNILEVSQTILKTEFAGIFLAAMPAELTEEKLLESLHDAFDPLGVTVTVKEFMERTEPLAEKAEPLCYHPARRRPHGYNSRGFRRHLRL